MCNSYESRFNVAEVIQTFDELLLPFASPPPAAAGAERRMRPTDPAPIVRPAAAGGVELAELRWGLKPPRVKGPVTNWRAEGRRFDSGRCLIVASAFHEFTGSASPKTRWRFSWAGESWFCIAGVWRAGADRDERFTMLTLEPGPDVAPYHDRQPAVLDRRDWARWLSPEPVPPGWLQPSPPGSLLAAMATDGPHTPKSRS